MFTQDELINAIREARQDEGDTPNSITTKELAKAIGVSPGVARERIRAAVEAGVLQPERVWRAPIMTSHRQRVLGFVLVERESPN